jgi:DNA-binding transcriptional ArsR family regulator
VEDGGAMMQKQVAKRACPAKASLQARPLMSDDQALAMEALFSVLEIARRDEVGTLELAETLEMKPQAVSNQLQRLQDKSIVARRRDGNNVYYRIVDNCVMILLERGLCLIEEAAKRNERSFPGAG